LLKWLLSKSSALQETLANTASAGCAGSTEDPHGFVLLHGKAAKPVIAILAEFDALPHHPAGRGRKTPIAGQNAGHGYHNPSARPVWRLASR
jgi:metal-dependent amidase/aminoacylase/carboxypeptidase family protein